MDPVSAALPENLCRIFVATLLSIFLRLQKIIVRVCFPLSMQTAIMLISVNNMILAEMLKVVKLPDILPFMNQFIGVL